MRERQPKPALREVFEHYGLHLSGADRQMASCIFHDESEPSLSINLTKGVYKCFACGASGDSWSAIQQKEGVDFSGAVAFAADKQWAEEDLGEGGGEVRVNRYGRGGGVASGSRDRSGGGRWSPPWRRG